MYISNATGCSSIWGNPGATNPYCTNAEGKGPAWCNSLFEDNAEHGFGMYLGQKAIRDSLIEKTKALIAVEWTNADLKAAAQKYLDTVNDLEANAAATKAYVAALEENVATVDELAQVPQFAEHAAELKAKGEKYCDCDACALGADILSKKDYLSKKSVWIFGGDGWAYDIGYGGLDHVLASKKTSTSSCSIPRSTPTPADRPPRLPTSVRSLSSPLPVRKPSRSPWRRSPCTTAMCTLHRSPWVPTLRRR